MDKNQSDRWKNKKAIKNLEDDLAAIDSDTPSISMEENEMLSLMVDETLKGVDIEARYPAFYRKLFSNAVLRQVFLDLLGLAESKKKGQLVPFPAAGKPNLAFLNKKPLQSDVEKLDENHWQIKWQKTVEQLQSIFSLTTFAYRSDASLFDEDAFFPVLHGEVNLSGSTYSVLLECGISKETEEALSAFLNLVVTLGSTTLLSQFPIYATLHWGKYHETLKMAEEGRMRFPDIPFVVLAFDRQKQSIASGLDLTLKIGP
jgi:hypothetical protein